MSKRIAAIAGLLVAFGATVAVAVAIWLDRAEDAGTEPEPAANGAKVVLQRKATGADGISGNSGDAALRMVDSRFALERGSFPLPVKPRLKRPPAAGVLFDIDSGEN